MASTSIEEATKICNEAGFDLVRYSGYAQRLKSTVTCRQCGHTVDVIIGELKAGRKCPVCKGRGSQQPGILDRIETIKPPLDFTAEEIAALKTIAQKYIKREHDLSETSARNAQCIQDRKNACLRRTQEEIRRQEIMGRSDREHLVELSQADQDVAFWKEQGAMAGLAHVN